MRVRCFLRFGLGCLVLVTPACAAPPAPTTQPLSIPVEHDRELRVVIFNSVGLSDAIDYLRDASDENFFVDWHGLEGEGIDRGVPITFEAHHAKLSNLLNTTLTKASSKSTALSFGFRDGCIIISTVARLRQLMPHQSDRTPGEHRGPSDVVLDKTIQDLSIDNESLSDAIADIAVLSGARLNVDWKKLEEAGIDRKAPVSIRMHSTQLSLVLDLILSETSIPEQHLTYSVGDRGDISISAVGQSGAPRHGIGDP